MSQHPRFFLGLALMAVASAASAATLVIPAPDMAKVAQQDARAKADAPYRYALPLAVKQRIARSKNAEWTLMADGRMHTILTVSSAGAKTLDLLFDQYWLPNGAELWVGGTQSKLRHGPYTDAHNNAENVLATPVIQGNTAVIEIIVPADLVDAVDVKLGTVNYGYRGFDFVDGIAQPKSGSCNVDTICPQGDAWRDQIRSVGRYTVNGGLCTGTLVNNTSGDRRPLFLTARHCFSTNAEAAGVVVYWRYESPTCRTPGSAASGTPIPVPTGPTNSGSTLLMTFGNSDMSLVTLNQAVPAAAQAYWAGWDRRDVTPSSAVGIHHPSGDEKRISFENNPLSLSAFSVGGINLPQGAALRVNDWDLGTTEQGSSGSALFNASKQLVGTLAGGAAACGNDLDDSYGRVFIGWAGGGAASNRLSDHLDPAGNGAQTLNGLDGTTTGSGQVQVAVRPGATVPASNDIFVDITVSGGTGPYTVGVDLEGDGVIDRTLSNVQPGQVQSVLTRYPRAGNFTVRATATNASGSINGQFGLSITNHDVRAQYGAATQICGDGDGLIEPGEQWRLPVTLTNSGTIGTANANSFAIFSKSNFSGGSGGGGGGATALATDSFGYRLYNTASGACSASFIDMAAATPLALNASTPAFPAQDDGVTGTLNLLASDGTNYGFELYGTNVNAVRISTNGYITANNTAIGNDISPSCDASPTADGGALRLNALHQDLVVQDIRALGFPSCPRPSAVGNATQPCLVVQWRGATLFDGGGGNFDVQAVIYPQTRAIVYQTRGTLPTASVFGTSTIGLQRPPQTPFNYTCTGAPRPITSGAAVCYYHPSALPAAGGGGGGGTGTLTAAQIRLTTPAIALNGLQPGASVGRNVDFHIDAAASCGSSFNVRYNGTVDENAASGAIAQQTVSIGGTGCAAVTSCPAPGNAIVLKPGAHFNPKRGGNGLIAYTAGDAAAPIFFGTWFTGEANRNPTWFIVQEAIQQNQVVAPLLRFSRTGNPPTWVAPTSQTVGQAQVTMIENGRFILTHQFDGQPIGGEQMVSVTMGLPVGNPNRTGAWFNPSESGWGVTFDSFIQGGVNQDFIASFLYDNSGVPRWLLGQGPAGALAATVFEVHCPSCAWLDISPTSRNVGTMNRNLNQPTSGTFTIDANSGAPQQIIWQRTNFPLQLLTNTPQ